ncbi:ferric reductase NAD binding domain-containing protein [Roridomyces roridus]|uniref:Ferric reductase NAD binding domain-containing protein n=1 Tax=Roridomyces roridus TaxID=1738132 RepID=A0AAD7FIK4_9AGAR|nr:ferric reductase NAD binding domain-containing protein [Roridomyces roridus]
MGRESSSRTKAIEGHIPERSELWPRHRLEKLEDIKFVSVIGALGPKNQALHSVETATAASCAVFKLSSEVHDVQSGRASKGPDVDIAMKYCRQGAPGEKRVEERYIEERGGRRHEGWEEGVERRDRRDTTDLIRSMAPHRPSHNFPKSFSVQISHLNNGGGGKKGAAAGGKVVSAALLNQPINRVLPRVMIDGPFGTSSEDFLDYETVFLVGAGIGVTPFASMLKSIWYKMNNFEFGGRRTRLSKVYFTWVIRDFSTAEWFHSLLSAMEEQDSQNRIEINIYLTGGVLEQDVNNIVVQDVGSEKDAITSLRAPTHFGRPDWERLFTEVGKRHPEADVGVFYCGPASLAGTLRYMSTKHSDPRGARFFFRKENF